jgi:putative hemolysin
MEVLLILALVLTNGVFAMSEIAVVSARQSRLEELAERGRLGARQALALKADPGAFLSTIQVGITLVGVLMGALGEAALAQPVRETLSSIPVLAPSADLLALVLVVGAITYLSVVIGELVPKQLALLAPEALASAVARPLGWLCRAALPVVWLLSASSALVVRLIGARRGGEPPVTDEEIRVLMAQGAEAGVFHAGEEPMVANVLRLDEQPIGAIMTPRNEIEALDLAQEPEALKLSLAALRHTLVPVHRDGLDEHLLGVLRLADLLPGCLATKAPSADDLRRLAQQPVFVPQSLNAAQLLETFRDNRMNLALIVDEYGSLEGLVTLADVLRAIVGTPLGDDVEDVDEITRRADGSWLVDGSLPLERLRTELGMDAPLPSEEGAGFHTLGGYVMHELGRVPQASEFFEAGGLRFEVVDMDQQRVDKVLVERAAAGGTNAGDDGTAGEASA